MNHKIMCLGFLSVSLLSFSSCSKYKTYRSFIEQLHTDVENSNYEVIMGFSSNSESKYCIFINRSDELGLKCVSSEFTLAFFLPKSDSAPSTYDGIYSWTYYTNSYGEFYVNNNLTNNSYFSFSRYQGEDRTTIESLANSCVKALIYTFSSYCWSNYNLKISSINMFPNM